ncbi:MAG: hypothetical protein H0V49_00470 [Nocardioidaceae bacterium]|nr:hypothetical protein [Nocardioidaceae bacterium]
MNDPAETLMKSGVVHTCPDCRGERIFVSIGECADDQCEYCCTCCGAAMMIDPAFDYSAAVQRVA